MSSDMTRSADTMRDKTPAETPETTTGGRIYRPLTDVVETDDGVTLMLEMPGVAAEDVDVTLEKRVLTVRGKAGAARCRRRRTQSWTRRNPGSGGPDTTVSASARSRMRSASKAPACTIISPPSRRWPRPRRGAIL